MHLRRLGLALSRFGATGVRWRQPLRLFWYRQDKAIWAFMLVVGLIFTILGLVLREVVADREHRENLARQFHEQHLTCLALNVYYEARGEPTAGQYAVAEVTMNRKASPSYPATVCAVVFQKSWDPIRRRYVAAFSWTELGKLAEPSGEEWERARRVAEAVYYETHKPAMQGALFFHATYVKPEWAKDKQRVARIGRHIFYR
jgi:spore germination cell wall hydrolase CwlJ-like protein